VNCRSCHRPVLLDPARMIRKGDHAELRCPECGALVPVRCTDVDRHRPDGIWSIASYAEEPETERRLIGHLFHCHPH
jgi:uncharacterized Zn finger protein